MSGLPPTPISGRKQSLRPRLRTPRRFPSVKEEPEEAADNGSSSKNNSRTQYDLAEEENTIEDSSDSERIGRGKQPERKSPEITESIQDTPSPSTAEYASIDVKKKIQKYQREVQASMNTKPVTTFNEMNYQM
ncbi:hypothetical protein AJ78_08666 [Emergomyces pasteurianus Ep9510]|uniref:Uncharacterized protein n=1 Tax=Emergomyces pasteurianus Ep9510 TaxID=1447872 RepID=A0A1J9PQX2_9EURO|nr:hypothetical protein AJ78_08666 [Emergomyces pasteurianus Ep9510]